MRNEQTFESDLGSTWKAIEETLRNYRITDRSPSDLSPSRLKRVNTISLKTDWIFTESRDKYQEYKVNGFPKRIYLQSRYRAEIVADRVIGGTLVAIKIKEEVERVSDQGKSLGYTPTDSDPSRASDLLQKIQNAMIAAPNS